MVCSLNSNRNLRLCFLLIFAFLFSGFQSALAQSIKPDPELLNNIENKYAHNSNFVFHPDIRSVKLTNPGWELSYPVLKLNSGQQLKLTFDELSPESNTYYYTVEHMNSDWTERDAIFTEYATGFEENEIRDYESSYSAIDPYTHYELLIPNDDIQFKISGNYLISVYDGNKENLLFTRRFIVYEQKTIVEGEVRRAMSENYGSTSHKIPFSVYMRDLQVNDPYTEIEVKVLPNNNWHKAHENYKPLFIKGEQLVYESKPANVFKAGNEYRTFLTKDLTYEAIMVESIERINYDYHVKLRMDKPRRYLQYEHHQDLNGMFYIDKSNSMTPNLDADYVNVYFTLDVETPILTGQVFVFGELTNYTFSSRNVMSYNPRKKQYELRLKLKQGYYDYQYVVLERHNDNAPDFSYIEGDKWQTNNDYLIYVYHKDLYKGYSKVVGFKTLRTTF
ncbi:hypothetical protein L21SP5_03819 [Salinivirga cyanobacteriivorans]|uniref:Type 9 secretion system plug protein N-terminal domain-containing protein n=1 Tax=Salinivirga cyanobacteriivorans TaxID=1307839 RepID=A0A0S2I5E9_9BACT|nr:DUF5103 domain-containing protein [Salinivirga cyanobacteriivorans]ALO17412.1 hypothetical protein L21SP5_03819 [Salinivirga cyanobacteriivorans]